MWANISISFQRKAAFEAGKTKIKAIPRGIPTINFNLEDLNEFSYAGSESIRTDYYCMITTALFTYERLTSTR
jgi:hypothetical protein